MTSTYFLVTTVEADSPDEAVELAREMDEPSEVPTIEDLAEALNIALGRFIRAREALVGDGKRTQPATDEAVARIIEIVTLGNVPATEKGTTR